MQHQKIRNKIFTVFFFLGVIIIGITAFFIAFDYKGGEGEFRSERMVDINEVRQLFLSGNQKTAEEKMDVLQRNLEEIDIERLQKENDGRLLALCGIFLFLMGSVFIYFYYTVLRPFDTLQGFAERIAGGDLDMPLDYTRSNYFGSFTWAFDHMRKEIIKARKNEKEAIENNKTIIATLSHDLKTPIASIRAYSEGLEANLDTSMEKREKYLSVIMRKCDEVAGLTNDLFLHSLSDLDKLKILPEKFEICEFLEKTVRENSVCEQDIIFEKPDFQEYVFADKSRLLQVIQNLLGNARKYAKTEIQIFLEKKNGAVEIHVKDFGRGIPEEDMPFIFEKFYRGKNAGEEQGSGLGLYIVKYIMEKMEGNISLVNSKEGLEVVLELPVIGD